LKDTNLPNPQTPKTPLMTKVKPTPLKSKLDLLNSTTKSSSNSTSANLSTTLSSEGLNDKMDKDKEKSPKIDKLSYGAVPRPFFKPSNNLINNYKSFKLEVEKD